MYMNTANQSCGMFQGSLQDLILGRQNPEWFEVTFYPDKIGCEYGSTTVVLVGANSTRPSPDDEISERRVFSIELGGLITL